MYIIILVVELPLGNIKNLARSLPFSLFVGFAKTYILLTEEKQVKTESRTDKRQAWVPSTKVLVFLYFHLMDCHNVEFSLFSQLFLLANITANI